MKIVYIILICLAEGNNVMPIGQEAWLQSNFTW